MTTAEARNQAMEAEKQLNWSNAASLWQYAIDHYPAHVGSQLADADIKAMKRRQAGCECAAECASADDISFGSRHNY